MNTLKLIGPFKQLIPMSGLPIKGALADEQLIVLENAGIIIDGEHITQIGNFKDLKLKFKDIEIHELKGDHTCVPGFVRCSHPHLFWRYSCQ